MKNSLGNGFYLNLKQKLFIGFGFFLLMVVMLGGIGVFFVYNISNRSASMLKENYQTVESTSRLMIEIDELKSLQSKSYLGHTSTFDTSAYLRKQDTIAQLISAIKNNITEIGEKEMVDALDLAYVEYTKAFEGVGDELQSPDGYYFNQLVPHYQKLRDLVAAVTQLNMAAIVHKNQLLRNTAQRAFLMISAIGAICFAISLMFFFKYPNKIVNPIRQLIAAIKEISYKNYEKRLQINSNDELQQLAEEFNAMAARLDEYEHSNLSKLVFEKRRIDTIINKMQDAIIGVDEGNVIVFCNELACQLLKVNSNGLVGQKAMDIAAQNPQLALIMSGIEERDDQSNSEIVPIKLYIDNKATFFTKEVIDVDVTRTDFEPPTKAGRVIVLKNVTQFLEQAQAKTNFIATISHELKTPLASLKLNLKLLEDTRVGHLNDEQRQIVSHIKSEAEKMKSISSELLDMAQIESGTIKLNIQKVWPEQIVEYTRETIKNQPNQNSLVFFDVQPGIPMLFCDPEKTAWVLINLITNAIKYNGDSQSVYVTVAKEEQTVRFTVQDFGPGIAPNYLDKIFDKFFRVPGNTEEGRGLGLSISKEFISQQNGKIWVESEIGYGSKFNFSLPVAIL